MPRGLEGGSCNAEGVVPGASKLSSGKSSIGRKGKSLSTSVGGVMDDRLGL